MNMNKKLNEYEKIKSKDSINKKISNKNIINKESSNTFEKEFKKIKNSLLVDINEMNEKQRKDVIIIIDINVYNLNGGIINQDNLTKIDSFIEQTKIIINEYLLNKDRIGVFIFTDEHQIICPLISKNEIDINSFSNDLTYYKNRINNIEKSINSINDENSYHCINDVNLNIGINIDSNKNYSSNGSQEDSIKGIKNKKGNNYNRIKGLIDTINYSQKYLSIKFSETNEKYIILFTDFFNMCSITKNNVENYFDSLNENEEIIFLLIGINNSEDNHQNEILNKIMNDKFNKKSEIICYDGLKKISKILSNGIDINDEIIYPNETYK